MELKFSVDTKHRKGWFTGISFSHPAKMSLPLQLWLIENYTKIGETILDPMAGSGTILVACSLGRDVICVELEQKFCDMMKGNWQKIQERGPQLGYEMGTATILQGDARNLEGVLVDGIITSPPYAEQPQSNRTEHGILSHPLNCNCNFCRKNKGNKGMGQGYRKQVDSIVTSPPYAEAQSGGGIAVNGYHGDKHSPTDLVGKRSYTPGNQGKSDGQISNLPYGSIDSVITSPPYESSVSDEKESPLAGGNKERYGRWKEGTARKISYTQNEPVDAVITSPPYEGSIIEGNENFEGMRHLGTINKENIDQKRAKLRKYQFEEGKTSYSFNAENIGNLSYGNFASNVSLCYNIDKCLLEFTLGLKKTKNHGLKPCEQNGRQVGQMRGNINVRFVAVKLINAQKYANPALKGNACLGESYLTNIEQAFVQTIKACLADDIQFNQELKCLSPYSRVENLERLLTNAITTQWNGKNGVGKFLNEINIPAEYATKNQKEGRVFILSHITLSQLLNILNLSLSLETESLSAENATIKPKVAKVSQNSETYLSAMQAVYKSCYRILKPQGLLILVTKNFIRNKAIVRLDEDTIKLCEQAGFKFLERHYRKLTSQSFWRVIYSQKHPEVPKLDTEDILIFEKETDNK